LLAQSEKISKQEETFEFFWNYFNTNYASFEDKNINWKSEYDKYREKVTANTSDNDLYQILCEMVKPLNDDHVNIRKSKTERFSASRPSRIKNEFKGFNLYAYYSMIDSTLSAYDFHPLKRKGTKVNGIPLFHYSINNEFGYLRINRSTGTRFYLTGTLLTLDKILKTFENTNGLIIDIRFNPGGTDRFAYKVAGRFTDEKYLGHFKQSRIEGDSLIFSELEPRYVVPKGKQSYKKPIILLTNDVTVSAADVLALVLKELPHVTIMGENTNGSFSDISSKRLPNGWKITLSKERYFSSQKINYEGIGVPVDMEVLNRRQDIELKNDRVLIEAILALRRSGQ
jgi:carboxyl-terminal processing protease